MFTSPDDLHGAGWIFAGDPGPFPPVDTEPDCASDSCPWGDGRAAVDDLAVAGLAVGELAAAGLAADGLAGWAAPGVPRPAAGPHPLLAALSGALDAISACGPLSGSQADTGALLLLAERARAMALREVGELDATGGHQQPGRPPTTAAAWLRDSRHLGDGPARATVRLARDLREDLPEVAALLAAGRISVEHAAAVAGGVRGLDRDLIRHAGDSLAALALVTDPVDLRRRLRDKAASIDDRLTADADRKARDRQHLRLSQVGAHTAVDGTLAGEDGATVRLAMALAAEAARTDGDTRSPTARNADTLVRWATEDLQRQSAGDSLATDAHTIRTHMLLTCTPDQLATATATGSATATATGRDTAQDGQAQDGQPLDGQPPTLTDLIEADLAGAGPVSPSIVGTHHPLTRAALRRLACDATISLAVLRTPGQDSCPAGCPTRPGRVCEHLAQPLYVGRSARTISGAQFKALVLRDRHCVVKGCHRPPAQCAGHHVQHWADGGTTDLDNLVLLCHAHHHDHHDRGHNLPHHDGQRWLTQTGWGRAPT
ncbi:MAG TPA: DUF222 domain-containing protein [Mycobacteriales bacterium]|nr:DUF222 domain-containing protein [Mycobacteriales bacterium]